MPGLFQNIKKLKGKLDLDMGPAFPSSSIRKTIAASPARFRHCASSRIPISA